MKTTLKLLAAMCCLGLLILLCPSCGPSASVPSEPVPPSQAAEVTENVPPSQTPGGLSYASEKLGVTFTFPAEWAGLVELKSETEDDTLFTLYLTSLRQEDDPTAGVLANLCAVTEDDFNGLYGDTDLDGMYEAGGPRVWVLGTVNGHLIYLQADHEPDSGAGKSEEFARLHQQLLESPCVTVTPLSH